MLASNYAFIFYRLYGVVIGIRMLSPDLVLSMTVVTSEPVGNAYSSTPFAVDSGGMFLGKAFSKLVSDTG